MDKPFLRFLVGVGAPVADILCAGVVCSHDDEDVLEVGADVLGGERQSPRLLEDDGHDVIPYVSLPQELVTGRQESITGWPERPQEPHPAASLLYPSSSLGAGTRSRSIQSLRSSPECFWVDLRHYLCITFNLSDKRPCR